MKYWLLCIFLWCAFSNPELFGVSSADTLLVRVKADSLKKDSKFFEASVQYQKLEFLSFGQANKIMARLEAVNCYKYNKNYKAGLDLLQSIDVSACPDSLLFRIKYQTALLSYLNEEFSQADAGLEQLYYLVPDSTTNTHALLLHSLIYDELYRWKDSENKLRLLNARLHLKESKEWIAIDRRIDSVFSFKNIPRLKDPEKAARLSTFLPGTGQFYSGNIKEGIVSMSAVLVGLAAMSVGIYYQYYFTGILGGNLFMAKFHTGGVRRAEFLAKQYNYKHSKRYNESVRALARNMLQ